jgi:hypothetical protein
MMEILFWSIVVVTWLAVGMHVTKEFIRFNRRKMIEPSVKKPSLFRRSVMKLVSGWRRVMDVRYNPLKHIPDPSLQTYFMLVLFVIWSVFFGSLAANYLGFFNYNTIVSIVIHVAIILPLAFTNAIFVDAERDGEQWLRNGRRNNQDTNWL